MAKSLLKLLLLGALSAGASSLPNILGGLSGLPGGQAPGLSASGETVGVPAGMGGELAALQRAVGDLKALAELKESGLAPQPLLLGAYEALVKAYGQRGDAAGVRKYLELAAGAGTKDAAIYVALAGEYSAEKRSGEALKLLAAADALGAPKGHPYYNALASAYEGEGDFAKAYDALKSGLTVNAPRLTLAETSKHLGLVCYELKRWPEAETYLAYALRAGAPCLECGLLLTTIRESLAPAPRGKKKRN